MFWIDIAICAIILLSLIVGFRRGILVQLCGIAGILIGIFVALRFGQMVGLAMGVEDNLAKAAGFAVLFLAIIIIVAIAGRALRGIFRFAGLGALDNLGGAVLAGLKAVLVMGLLLMVFDSLNRGYGWMEGEVADRSKLEPTLREAAGYVVPYFNTLKEKL